MAPASSLHLRTANSLQPTAAEEIFTAIIASEEIKSEVTQHGRAETWEAVAESLLFPKSLLFIIILRTVNTEQWTAANNASEGRLVICVL